MTSQESVARRERKTFLVLFEGDRGGWKAFVTKLPIKKKTRLRVKRDKRDKRSRRGKKTTRSIKRKKTNYKNFQKDVCTPRPLPVLSIETDNESRRK